MAERRLRYRWSWILALTLAAPWGLAVAGGLEIPSSESVWSFAADQEDAYTGRTLAAVGDVDGDGYDDFIVGSRDFDDTFENAGRAWLFYGDSTGPSSTPDVIFTPPALVFSGFFAQVATGAGDVNGDGYDDVMITMTNWEAGSPNWDEGGVFVYHGSELGIDTSYDWVARGNRLYAHLGIGAGRAGDVNGDGYDDIIVGAVRYDSCSPATHDAYVFFGSATGLNAGGTRAEGTPENADWTAAGDQCVPNFPDWFGAHVGTAGDVNGDGYSDVFVAAPYYDGGQTDEGKVFVWRGSETGLGPPGTPANADWSAEGNQVSALLGGNIDYGAAGSAGDVNGDGYDDFLVGAYLLDAPTENEGAAFLWLGSAGGLTAGDPDWTATGQTVSDVVGFSVAGAGDVNGDGYDDFLVGQHGYDIDWDGSNHTNEGRALLWFGSRGKPLGPLPLYSDCLFTGEQALASFGATLAGAGDVDGDGYEDLLIGAVNHDDGQSDEGTVFGFRGEGWVFFEDFDHGDLLRWSAAIP